MKIRFILFVLGILALSVNMVYAGDFVARDTAVVAVMTKAAGRAHEVRVPVGGAVDYDKVAIRARTCLETSPYDPQNYFAFIEVKRSADRIFSGWMNKNEPGDNPVTDAAYDVWLVRCE